MSSSEAFSFLGQNEISRLRVWMLDKFIFLKNSKDDLSKKLRKAF